MPTEKIEIPEEEIIALYVKNVWWTIAKLAKKFKVTQYRVRKLLETKGVLRKTAHLEKMIIERCLKYERQFDANNVGMEMMLARRLLQEFPEETFWSTFDLGFKLNSLAFLNSDRGRDMLKRKYGQFKFEIPQPVQHNIGTEKVGEDIIITKPRTLKDFMKED